MAMQWIKVTGLLVALAVFGRCYNATAVEQQLAHSYAPVTVDCPYDIEWIRPAIGLSPKEAEWVANRKKVVTFALGDYLERLGMEDFNVGDYLCRLVEEEYASVPIIGFAISGGGWASALTGTGALRALDSRLEAAREQRVGGLLQSMTYMSGLSGGAWPIVSFATSNFPTADEILQDWQPQITRLLAENDTQYAATPRSVFEDMGAKAEAGFNVSFGDYLGRALAYEYIPGPHGGLNVTMSSISTLSNFVNHQMPLPLLQATSILDSDVEYYGLKVPLRNSTVFESTPFEFGSWDETVQAFTPMEWLGTALDEGSVVNQSECIRGFDRASFIMGSAGTALNFWYIEDVSNGSLATFTKRGIDPSARHLVRRQQSSGGSPEAGFPIQYLEELIGAFNESFHLPLDEIAYGWYPNPFAGLPSVSRELRGPSLKLVDASENGQAIPLWTQIQPARSSNFIIAWDDAGDAKPYSWNNGTNLYDTYVRANEVGIPFPVVPSASTFIARNYTTQPVFFGCDASLTTTKDSRSPIVAYFANAPYSAYTNISYFQTNTSMAQVGEMWVNSFDQMTQANGTLDTEWPVCLGCAAIERSLAKVGLQRTEQCQRCFDKYCWDGVSVEEYPGTETVDTSLVLDPSLGFLEWVKNNPYGT